MIQHSLSHQPSHQQPSTSHRQQLFHQLKPSRSILPTILKSNIDKKLTNSFREEVGYSPSSPTNTVEAMSGPQRLDRSVDLINTTRSTYLELPSRSNGRSPSPRSPRSPLLALTPSPDPSRGHRKKQGRIVHWDPSVVDNEYKMQSRSKKSAAAMQLSKPQVASGKPSEHPASSKSPTANTPVKMNPSASRQQSNYNFVQSHRPMSPPCPEHSRAPAHRPAETLAGPNSASKMASPKRKSHATARKAPPAVPDAPRAYYPPPAPRPARLPTPDLPEIDEAKFFVPKDKLFDFSRGRSDPRGRPIHQKTDNQREWYSEASSEFC